jgi:hypothetical protein
MTATWDNVSLEDGFALANQGVVVVGGLANSQGHGHVIVIYPGTKIPGGGYTYWYPKTNKFEFCSHLVCFPGALSTRYGSAVAMPRDWPGSLSCGDKTVWDPWGRNDLFDQVEFFTPKTEDE